MVGPTSTEDGEKMSVPLIVVTFEKEDVTLPERTTDAQESGRVASLMGNSFILGLMLGCTLIVGVSAVWITSILACKSFQLQRLRNGSRLTLLPLHCSIVGRQRATCDSDAATCWTIRAPLSALRVRAILLSFSSLDTRS